MRDEPRTYEELRAKFDVDVGALAARCRHFEAGLKVIAQTKPTEDNASTLMATTAFAQSTLDEAPEAK